MRAKAKATQQANINSNLLVQTLIFYFVAFSSKSNSIRPLVEQQAFIFPTNLDAMKETITEMGITSKHLLSKSISTFLCGHYICKPWLFSSGIAKRQHTWAALDVCGPSTPHRSNERDARWRCHPIYPWTAHPTWCNHQLQSNCGQGKRHPHSTKWPWVYFPSPCLWPW